MKTLHINIDIMNPNAVAKVIELSNKLKEIGIDLDKKAVIEYDENDTELEKRIFDICNSVCQPPHIVWRP